MPSDSHSQLGSTMTDNGLALLSHSTRTGVLGLQMERVRSQEVYTTQLKGLVSTMLSNSYSIDDDENGGFWRRGSIKFTRGRLQR